MWHVVLACSLRRSLVTSGCVLSTVLSPALSTVLTGILLYVRPIAGRYDVPYRM